MNELDHASLEASKKLVDAGIVLETEKYFEIPYEEDSDTFCQVNNNGTDAAVLPAKIRRSIKIPRPCFTEVWRELPHNTWLRKDYIGRTNIMNEDNSFIRYNINPTDALIELLIHIKGAGK